MELIKSTLKHASIYSLSSALGKAISFFMLPFYAHLLRGTGYGIIGMIDATLSLLMNAFCFGITGSIIRFYHEMPFSRKNTVLSTALQLLWIANFIAFSLIFPFSISISTLLLGDSNHHILFLLGLISFFFDLTGTAASTLLVIQQRSILISIISIIRLFISLPSNIFFCVKYGIYGYFLSNCILTVINSVLFNIYIFYYCGFKFDWSIAKLLIGFEAPMIPGNILTFFARQAERVIVRFLMNIESVGILEMGYKFAPLINIFIFDPFMQAWHTKRTEIADQNDSAVVIGKMFSICLFFVVFAGLVLAVNVKEFIYTFTPEEFWAAVLLSRIEILSTIIGSCYYHLFFGLYYAKQTRKIAIIKGVSSLLKLPASYILISRFGINGAAISGLFLVLVQVIWSGVSSYRYFKIRLEIGKLFTICLCGSAFYFFIEYVNWLHLAKILNLFFSLNSKLLLILQLIPFSDITFLKLEILIHNNIDTLIVMCFKTSVCLFYLPLYVFVSHSFRAALFNIIYTRYVYLFSRKFSIKKI